MATEDRIARICAALTRFIPEGKRARAAREAASAATSEPDLEAACPECGAPPGTHTMLCDVGFAEMVGDRCPRCEGSNFCYDCGPLYAPAHCLDCERCANWRPDEDGL